MCLDFGTTTLDLGRKKHLDLVSLSAQFEDVLSESPERDTLVRDQEMQITEQSLQKLTTLRTQPSFLETAEEEEQLKDVDIALNFKVYHQSLEFILSECTNLLKLSSSGRFCSSGLPVDPLYAKDACLQRACPPFWRVVERLRGSTLVCLDVDYRSITGRELDLSRFTRLRFLGLRPPGIVDRDDDGPGCQAVPVARPSKLPLVEYLSYSNRAHS